MQLLEKTNLMGAYISILFYVSAILVFVSRLVGKPKTGYWIGIFEFCLIAPMVYLLIKAPELNRPVLYYVQIGLMIAWLVLEILLDYILKIDFRQVRWAVICYITLFFAGTGGILGVAVNAGRGFGTASIILFLVMAVLAFIQRFVTGM